ncbi:MAG: hypothetical protein II912_10040 [Clostridia bacterium]|nr:hypothetical protein [Clostridia bacterium]
MKRSEAFFTKKARVLGLIACDAILVIVCAFASLLTKFAPIISPEDVEAVLRWLPWLTLCYIAVFAVFRMYRVLWKYADSFQLFKQGLAVIVAFGVTFGVNFVYERAKGSQALSNNFLIILCMFVMTAVCGFRLCIKLLKQYRLHADRPTLGSARRIMVVGAGDAGSHLVEVFNKSADDMGTVDVIVDDDPMKRGYLIGDVPVAGSTDDIARLAESEAITDIIIALPTASKERLKELTDICISTGCFVRVMDKLKHPGADAMPDENEG